MSITHQSKGVYGAQAGFSGGPPVRRRDMQTRSGSTMEAGLCVGVVLGSRRGDMKREVNGACTIITVRHRQHGGRAVMR